MAKIEADVSKKNKINKFYSDATKSKPAESSPTTPSPNYPWAFAGPSKLPPSSLVMGGNPKPAEKSKTIQEGLGAFNMKGEWEKLIPGILNDAKDFTNAQILDNIKKAATIMQLSSGTNDWTSDESQSQLLRRIHAESKPPSAAPRQWGRSTGTGASSLSHLDFTNASKALIYGSLSAVGADEEWVEIELTADSGSYLERPPNRSPSFRPWHPFDAGV